ncbi:unnamed protein product [Pieris macdunnoughi]|uniref:Uncharacterized protein n=1 Tax=Pieris macdunnoughi TaxID=345717 RepID=A0A821VQN4_9NEOP|nr:unnamed protein product [Pieris macdunnoughi]
MTSRVSARRITNYNCELRHLESRATVNGPASESLVLCVSQPRCSNTSSRDESDSCLFGNECTGADTGVGLKRARDARRGERLRRPSCTEITARCSPAARCTPSPLQVRAAGRHGNMESSIGAFIDPAVATWFPTSLNFCLLAPRTRIF